MTRTRALILAVSLALVAAGACRPAPRLFDPRDTNRDGYVDCEEDPKPDENDLPCGFRDGQPVGG